VTPQEAKELAARLICLSRAAGGVGGFALPLKVAARWVRVADLPGFTDEVEKRLRDLASVFDDYLARNQDLLEQCDRDTRFMIESELADVRKHLGLIPKIAWGQVELDIEDRYLPPSLGGTPEP
jgi:hypothetical protein